MSFDPLFYPVWRLLCWLKGHTWIDWRQPLKGRKGRECVICGKREHTDDVYSDLQTTYTKDEVVEMSDRS